MHIGHESRALGVLVVTLHEEPASFIVQTGFGKGHNEETANYRQHVTQRSGGGPILLEGIDANGPGRHVHVGMVQFRQEKAPGWRRWKVVVEDELEYKKLAFVRSAHGTLEFGLAERMEMNE